MNFRSLTYFLLLLPIFTNGQNFFRLKADFSIKEKYSDGHMSLSKGTVYYDLKAGQIVYKVMFPEESMMVITDSLVNVYSGGKLKGSLPAVMPTSFSVFYLALTSNFQNYGLGQGVYSIEKVEKDKDLVVSTWQPAEKMKGHFGKVMTATKDKTLEGIVFHDPSGTVIYKQFFRNWSTFNGLIFPGEIIEMNMKNEGAKTKVITYSNITVNEMKENEIYNFRAPR